MIHCNPLRRLAARVSLGVAAVSLAVVPAFAQSNQQNQKTQQRPTAANATTVSAQKLSDDPQNYYGKTVTVKDDVADVLGPTVFTLDDGEFLGTSPDILVFAPNAEASPNEDHTVTVTGKVQKFAQADLVNNYGWGWGAYPWGPGWGYGWYGPGYGPDYWVQYNNRPVIVASSVKTASGKELVANNTSSSPSGEVGTSGRANAGNVVTDASQLSGSSAASHINDRVRLSNMKVDRLTSNDRGFWGSVENGPSVFVALDRNIAKPNLKPGDRVTIAGKIMQAPKDKNAVNASKWGLSDQDVSQLTNDRVFIRANAVQTQQQRQQQ